MNTISYHLNWRIWMRLWNKISINFVTLLLALFSFIVFWYYRLPTVSCIFCKNNWILPVIWSTKDFKSFDWKIMTTFKLRLIYFVFRIGKVIVTPRCKTLCFTHAKIQVFSYPYKNCLCKAIIKVGWMKWIY